MEGKEKSAKTGLAVATAVYLAWGILPAYWKLLRAANPATIIAHRALWAFAFTAGALGLLYRPKGVLEPLKDGKTLLLCLLASLSLVVQWIAYLYAVATDQLVNLSLGYFIYPIIVAAGGTLFLRERLSLPQKLSLGLACAGVLAKILQFGAVPVLALTLAISFAAYSLIKRKIGLGPVNSIFYEFLFMTPIALAYLGYSAATGRGFFAPEVASSPLLLVGGGVLTAATLFLFAEGARRIPVFMLGLLQYISPTIVLLLGVLAYGEPFGLDQWIVFGLIWAALIVSLVSGARPSGKPTRARPRA